MAVLSNNDREIAIDVIAEKLNEVIDRRANSLNSIDILALAIDLVDSFDSILSFMLHTTEAIIIYKNIVTKLNKAGVPVNEDDVKEIVNTIIEKTDKTRKNNL